MVGMRVEVKEGRSLCEPMADFTIPSHVRSLLSVLSTSNLYAGLRSAASLAMAGEVPWATQESL